MAVQRKAFRKQSVVSEVVIAMRMHFFWCLLFVFPRYSSSNIFCSHPFRYVDDNFDGHAGWFRGTRRRGGESSSSQKIKDWGILDS
mmetsp:Transcript_55370/g.109778  ORF Transcript_55370/g.109778 Transcript_55370/m.109778 type:complete len:86 (-) Transcript_55370:1538-1795(-)